MKKMNFVAGIFSLVAAAAVMLLSQFTIALARNEVLENRFASLVSEIDTRCGETDQLAHEDNDWIEEYEWYSRSMVAYFDMVDKRNNTFAAVYDSSWTLLSVREATFTGQPFNPFVYPELMKTMNTEKQGTCNVIFDVNMNGNTVHRPLRVYFRKVPKDREDEYLTIIAGIPFTKDNAELNPLMYIVVFSGLGMAILALAMLIFMFTKYSQRYGSLIEIFNNVKG